MKMRQVLMHKLDKIEPNSMQSAISSLQGESFFLLFLPKLATNRKVRHELFFASVALSWRTLRENFPKNIRAALKLI